MAIFQIRNVQNAHADAIGVDPKGEWMRVSFALLEKKPFHSSPIVYQQIQSNAEYVECGPGMWCNSFILSEYDQKQRVAEINGVMIKA